MLAWFTNRSTKERVLINVSKVFCEGYGIEYQGVVVNTSKVCNIGTYSRDSHDLNPYSITWVNANQKLLLK